MPSPAGRQLTVLALVAAILAACALLPAHARAATAPGGPTLSVTAACLIDGDTGQALYTDNAEVPHAIASTTKLMTALIVLQHVKNLNQEFTQNDFVPASDDSQIGLVPGERMSVRDLLYAMMLPSADDAAEDLAYNVGGHSIARFVAMMNAEARTLGLTHTHYSTPIGLDTPGNYSTSCDLVKLARYDLSSSGFFRRMVDAKAATLTTGNEVRHITNLDYLLDQYPWINGVKTGHTNDAGYVLVSSGTQHGMTLIGSVLGTSSEDARDDNGLALLQYGFRNFIPMKPVTAGAVVARLPVKGRPDTYKATVIAGATFAKVLNRRTVISRVVQLPKQLIGPLPRHRVVGHMEILGDGTRIATVPLLLARALPRAPSSALSLGRATTILIIIALIAIVTGLLVVWRGRSRASEIELTRVR